MRRNMKWFVLIMGVILILPGLTGCSQSSPTVAVKAAPASQQDMEASLQLSGVLVPVQSVDISSKITGRVEKVSFGAGSQVKQGDVLVQLDTESIGGQLLQAQASLRNAQAALQSAKNQADLAHIALATAQRTYDRKAVLSASGAVAQNELEEARDEVDTARNRYATASGPALEQAQAAIDTAQANIRNFTIQLDNATIRSPIDGVIANQNIDTGEVLSTGNTVISIVDTSTVKLKTTITQTQLSYIKTGQAVIVTVDGSPGSFSGTVSVVGPVSVSTGEVFPVEISIKNDGTLMAGMAAQAQAKLKVTGLLIPVQAVAEKNGEHFVFVIKDNTATRRVVGTGFSNGQMVQVITGLAPEELVAVSNVSALADGTRVEVQ